MNNRQGGRRRGRGGQRPQGLGGGGGGGSGREQRSRGNAAQLLEKYKNMARDAQLAGDRVQTEYYLQFADHYFRVLSETRSRFEDQRPSRDDDEDEGEEEGFDGEGEEERRDSGGGVHGVEHTWTSIVWASVASCSCQSICKASLVTATS